MRPLEVRRAGQNGMAKLTFAKAERIRALRAKGSTVRELAAKYGVSTGCIYDVLSGRRYLNPDSPPVPARAHRARKNHR